VRRGHEHDCETCGKPYACGGTYWHNHDGWPEAVCTAWHERHERECEDCHDAPRCAWCGKRTDAELIPDGGDMVHAACMGEQVALA
jgi:hypothetical protein